MTASEVMLLCVITQAGLGFLTPVPLAMGFIARTLEQVSLWRKVAGWCLGLAAACAVVFVAAGLSDALPVLAAAEAKLTEPEARQRLAAARTVDVLSLLATGLALSAVPALGYAVLSVRVRRKRRQGSAART